MASGFYPSIQAWEADITQIFLNAMAFAENSSRLHKDAKLLHVSSVPLILNYVPPFVSISVPVVY
jgi:hypothetical protein